MPFFKLLLFSSAFLVALVVQAKGLYLEHKEVTQSSYYTGTPGSAQASAMPNGLWIMEHSENTADLGIRDQGFVIEDNQLTELVYGIANKLLAQWPGDVPPIAIFVQGDRSPLAYGAQTTFYGEIFINYGVFLHAESEDELAAVIGHELSHVLLGHGNTLKYRKSVENSLNVLSGARELYAKADGLRFDEATNEVSIDPSVEGKLKKSAVQKVLANRFYKSVHATLFSRGNEHDADRLAMDLMVAAGYSPMGIKASLERMAHSHDLSTEISDYLSTSSQTLLQQSLEEVTKAFEQDNANSENLDQYLDSIKDESVDSALKFGKKTLIDFSAKSHPVPSKRVKQITEYLYDEYPRSVRRRKIDKASVSKFREGHIAELIERYSLANQAVEAVGFDNLAAAQELSKAALKQPAGSHPYTRYAAFVTSRARGDQQGMAENVQKIDRNMLMPVFATTVFADFLSATGKTGEASGIMNIYEGYFGTVVDYYPPKIRISVAEEKMAETQQLTADCFAAVPPDSRLSEQCVQVSGIARPVAEQKPASESTKALGNFFKGLKK